MLLMPLLEAIRVKFRELKADADTDSDAEDAPRFLGVNLLRRVRVLMIAVLLWYL